MKTFSLFEYLLIISPSEEISRFVWHLKRIFADRYGCTIAASSAPHITMGNWGRSDHDEARIIASISGFAETISPFIAHFDGLGNFKTQTIFINVLNKEPFAEIRKGLKDLALLESDVIFPSVPHLTVARSMKADQFESAWSEWKDEEFKASCEVNGMILLRKSLGKEGPGKYQTIATFPFRGKTPPIKQLALDF
jgi:2'-5' RNA ligase